MFSLKRWLNLATKPQSYIWIEALLIKETPKALLIEFDDRKIWFPRAWILHTKRNQRNRRVNIKISQYHWGKRL